MLIDDYEIKEISEKEALNYKYVLGKMIIDMSNSQNQFLDPLQHIDYDEKKFIKDNKSFDNAIKEIYKNNLFFVVIIKDNDYIAYSIIGKRNDKTYSIPELFIKKEYRNKGLGKKFLQEIINIIKNKKIKMILIGAILKNKVAVDLYHSFGFVDNYVGMGLKI